MIYGSSNESTEEMPKDQFFSEYLPLHTEPLHSRFCGYRSVVKFCRCLLE